MSNMIAPLMLTELFDIRPEKIKDHIDRFPFGLQDNGGCVHHFPISAPIAIGIASQYASPLLSILA